MKQQKHVRFDWAIKRLLRQKANFNILEGFLSELLKDEISILEIIDTESKYILWFKYSGKLLNANEPVIFGIVYIPPESSKIILFGKKTHSLTDAKSNNFGGRK